jgi:hypothetical protein
MGYARSMDACPVKTIFGWTIIPITPVNLDNYPTRQKIPVFPHSMIHTDDFVRLDF